MEGQAEEPEKITCFTHNEDSFAAAVPESAALRMLVELTPPERTGQSGFVYRTGTF